MSRWWERERTRTAARIRSTRSRLRASYRGTLSRVLGQERAKIHEQSQRTLKLRLADLERYQEELEKQVASALEGAFQVHVERNSMPGHVTLRLEVILANPLARMLTTNKTGRRVLAQRAATDLTRALEEGP